MALVMVVLQGQAGLASSVALFLREALRCQ